MLSLALLLVAVASTFVDARDGRAYHAVRIGGLHWLAENLAYASADSRCYGDDPANCATHGRLYRIHDAMTACPPGWRLPSEEDWRRLERAIGMSDEEITKPNMRGIGFDKHLLPGGSTGFNGQLGGWYDAHLGQYKALGESAAYWSSTLDKPQTYWHRDLKPTRGGIWRSPVDDSYWTSVRCVR